MSAHKKPTRVLLVDDEEEFLLATSQALRRRGFEVTAAPNGVTALETFTDQVFDVVVLDVRMPDINGIEVFDQIRNREPAVPVIILTGDPSISDAFQTSKHGIAGYLSKPVEMDELAHAITRTVAAGTSAAHKPSEQKATAPQPPISVLIVDDETELLDSLQRVFKRRGMNTLTADSGPKALTLLEEGLVDVMVLDVKMPGMDGLDVLRRIKERFPSVQVILLSGHPSVEAALEGIKLGASEYLKKPPDIDALVATITRLNRQRLEMIEEEQKKLIDEILRRYAD